MTKLIRSRWLLLLLAGWHARPLGPASTARRCSLWLFASCVMAACLFFQATPARAYGATECAASRFGSNLNCTANDVSINTITVASGFPTSCVGGQTMPLDLNVTVQFGSATRYNIGVFVSNDGKSPQKLPASGGAAMCSVAVLPTSSPFLSLDGGSCGDGNGSISGGAGNGTFTMSNVAVPCTTDGSGNATLSIPYLVSWDQSSNFFACTSNTYPAPGTTSKCNTGTVNFPPGTVIVVLPAISITDGVTSVTSGGTVTYTVVITNTTASPLNGAVFTDPAVSNLNIGSVSCVAAGGAACPASMTVAAMQGAGINLPSMPNNSTLTFTVVGTVGTITTSSTLTNIANVTVSTATNSASDTDTILVPYAEYRMDEVAWSGTTGEVLDNLGSHSGTAVSSGSAALPTKSNSGYICKAGSFPANTTSTAISAVDTGITPQSLGNSGSISLWYNGPWNDSTSHVLFDAGRYSVGGIGYCPFNLVKRFDGRLYFVVSDSNCAAAFDGSKILYTGYSNPISATYPPAHTGFTGWHHIVATWSLGATASLKVYVDGVLDSSETTQVSTGVWPSATKAFDTLYIGDNRTSGVTPWNTFIGNIFNMPGTANSAAGLIDEVHIYSGAMSGATILNTASASGTDVYADYHMTRTTCGSIPDHYELSLPASSVACMATTATVTACADSSSPCTNPSTFVSGSTAVLAATGGALASSAIAFNASGVASTTLSYPTAADGTLVPVTLSGESMIAVNPRKCCQGSSCIVANSCSTTFNTAGFVISNTATGAAGTIPTQVAGINSSSYYLRAVKTGSTTKACEAALAPGTTSVNFAYECNNPTTCSSSNLMSVNVGASPTSITRNDNASVTSYAPVNLTFDANGSAPFTFNYGDVGQVKLWASKPAGGTLLTALAGSSNAFVVKPDHFDISDIKRTSDGFPNPAAAGAGDTVFIKAGAPFTVTVKALSASGATTPNYGKETTAQGVRLVPTLASPVGGDNPALSNGLIAGAEFGSGGQVAGDANGVATVTNLAWGEVGIITLNAIADNVGANDYLGGGAVSGATTGTTGNVGRFVPDHFDTVVTGGTTCPSALTCPCAIGSACPPAVSNGFVYSGQAFTTNVTARNAAGAPTINYDSARGYSKQVTLSAWDATGSTTTANPPGGGAPGSFAAGSATIAAAAFNLGSATALPNYSLPNIYPSATSPPGPTNIFMRAIDTDTTTSRRVVPSASIENGIKIVSGRIRMSNAHGSELQKLPIGVTAQYWNGERYVTSDTHSFTIPTASVVFGNCLKNLLSGAACKPAPIVDIVTPPNPIVMTNGVGKFTMKAPGAGNHGSADMTINVFSYLPSTTNRATFGIYKAGPIIYIRELY